MTAEHEPRDPQRPHLPPDQGVTAPPERTDAMHDGQQHEGGMPHAGMDDPDEMMRQQRVKTLWMYVANIILGLWLLAGAVAVDYGSARLAWSDAISGALIVGFGVLALWPRGDFWGRWGICLVGLWLLFAPLVFWASTPFAYANETLVGALVIAFSVLAPMMPGKAHHMAMMLPGPDIPPGWTYNPSTWWQRAPMIALAIVGFLMARYLTAYQLGHIDVVWDPFFVPGTAAILTSEVSRAWPISDAGLGAVAYLLEALMGFMGGVRRWRTMPWMVLAFGILVVPLGITSIILVILQPVMVGTWCTLCLATAFFMLVMIPLALDEVVAMIQFLLQARREGQPLWRTFWVGGTIAGGATDERSPQFDAPSISLVPAMVWGVNVPWSLLVSTLIGFWLMAAPVIFGATGRAANSDFLVGPLVAVIAVIAMAEVARPFRFLNIAFGLWLIAAPWLLAGATAGSTINDAVAGLVLIALSLPRGPVRERYGGWQRYIVGKSALAKPVGEQIVVVTGASSGVGRAVARAFGRRGARLGLLARNEDGLHAAAAEIRTAGGEALVCPIDVADAAAVEQAAAAVEARWGHIDTWVNCAMATVFAPVTETTSAEFQRVTEVTYLGYVHGTLAALHRMLPRDEGTIVQVGSALAYRSIPLQAAYCAAKHAVVGFTDSLRSELIHGGSSVRVTVVHLPAVNTPQSLRQRNKMPHQQQPVPPMFAPEVIAEAILWAAEHAPRELLVGAPTLKAIWGQKVVPGLLDHYLSVPPGTPSSWMNPTGSTDRTSCSRRCLAIPARTAPTGTESRAQIS
jgi:short-subunit dehydrogenase